MRYICVFCSASDIAEKYTKPSVEFAIRLAQAGYGLVWGGSDKGLMKLIATAVQDHGGRLVGVSVEHLKNLARKNADEMIIAKTLGERKETMLARSDAIAVMPGGIGTLDELAEMIELKKHNLHTRPIVVLNTENFYEGLNVQLQKMKDEGFITRPLEELVFFARTPHEALQYISSRLS